MEHTSPFLAMQEVERQLKAALRIDTDLLDSDQRKLVPRIKRIATDARLDIRDYELSETREEQLAKAKDARKRLKELQAAILAVGNVFGSADVAEYSARIDHINGRLV